MRRLFLPLIVLVSGCTTTVNAVVTPGSAAAPAAAASPKASAKPAAASLPEAGSEVDLAFWQAHHPAVVKGQTWTYQTAMAYQSRPGDETPYEQVLELTEIAGAKLKFLATDKADGGARTSTLNGEVGPLVPPPTKAWTYYGTEDVTVPAGSFKGALKLVAADMLVGGVAQLGGTIWLVPDTGIVKFVTNGDYHQRQELKAVTKP